MIYHKPLFIEILIFSLIISFIHYFAAIYGLYWAISWLDILMHFLGGLLIGLIVLFVFFTSEKIDFPKENRLMVIIFSISLVLVVGLLWELWELYVGIANLFTDSADTIMDLVMDIIGAIFAYFYSTNKIWKKR